MPDNNCFFADQTEQSAVKAHIVSSYFSAWSRVIQKWDTPMAYIDLFCGPGKYGDNNLSAPLLIIESTLENPKLLNKMRFVLILTTLQVSKNQSCKSIQMESYRRGFSTTMKR